MANEGVTDLLLNFICSCRNAKIQLKDIVVFVAQKAFVPMIKSFGVHAFYHKHLGEMPSASETYGDFTFQRMMWFKASTVYLVSRAGFDILFQDADLVWLKDPITHIKAIQKDLVFMDDGIRSPRFSPFFINSGFYFLRKNSEYDVIYSEYSSR